VPTGDRKLDEFASIFRSAVKEVFQFQPPKVVDAVWITDQRLEDTDRSGAEALLSGIDSAGELTWRTLAREDWVDGRAQPIAALLTALKTKPADLIVTRRHLLGADKGLQHTLGSVVDMLSQQAPTPLLLLPPVAAPLPTGTARCMAVTDHLTGDDDLVNWAVHVTHRTGTLYLAHVEDDATLERYLSVIDKLRGLDSDAARQLIPEKLLELPRTYIQTIVGALQRQGIEETVLPIVRMGHALSDYVRMVEEQEIDLLIVHTKDDRQSAMHGLAHALAVEIRSLPLLLL
jgi:nucleotide-binding universal stress UspA family protein